MKLGRRQAVLATMGLAIQGQGAPGPKQPPPQPRTRVGFVVPRGACDCHTHIFGDPATFPFFEGRKYTPSPALPSDLKRMHKALRDVERVVIVQPSVYGTDNRATLWGMREMGGPKRARGIAVIDPATVTTADLRDMDRQGIRGIRINATPIVPEQLRQAFAKAKEQNWHVQINTSLTVIESLKAMIEDAPVPVVIDHVAGAIPAQGPQQPGFQTLVDLVRTGKAYVKVTHRYLSTSKSPMFEDAEALARQLLQANPQRILWGTDWPHPGGGDDFDNLDDGRLLNHTASWCELNLKTVLVENPARLYGF
ncbi:hydrolase [Bryobacterales bacterium F-183]|nr:hydrolase [Bryobacterales bacterium F-183]